MAPAIVVSGLVKNFGKSRALNGLVVAALRWHRRSRRSLGTIKLTE